MSCKHGNWAPCELCDAESALEMRIEELELERDALLEQLESARANARLIAAAPDLLEALQWYEAKAVQMGRAAIHQDSKLMLALMKEIAVEYGAKARAAIAKATGEQP